MISLHGTVAVGAFARQFSLDVGNEIVGVFGANGIGKTSLLRTIVGLCPLGEGELIVNGVIVDAPAKHLFVQPELRNIGMVFQDHSLFPFMTALDNAAFPLTMRGVKRNAARKLASEMMDQFGVANVANQLGNVGAMQQGFSQQQLDAIRNLPLEQQQIINQALGINVGGGSGMQSSSSSGQGLLGLFR